MNLLVDISIIKTPLGTGIEFLLIKVQLHLYSDPTSILREDN
jgi:hypothetical protein